MVKDVYPAYITWEEHERVLATIEENRQKMAERLTRKQAIRCGAALLTGLVRCGRCGHAMQVIYKDNRFQYVCNVYQSLHAKPNCQHIGGRPIDEAVVREFFQVLRPAEIDALEAVNAKQAEHRRELERHLEQDVRRLEYAARRAERQYDSVDPENRLIASTLESRWEAALVELEQAKARLAGSEGPGHAARRDPGGAAHGLRRRRPPPAGDLGAAPGRGPEDDVAGPGDGGQPRPRRERDRPDEDRVERRAGHRDVVPGGDVVVPLHGAGRTRSSNGFARRSRKAGTTPRSPSRSTSKAFARAGGRASPPRSSGSSAAAIAS